MTNWLHQYRFQKEKIRRYKNFPTKLVPYIRKLIIVEMIIHNLYGLAMVLGTTIATSNKK